MHSWPKSKGGSWLHGELWLNWWPQKADPNQTPYKLRPELYTQQPNRPWYEACFWAADHSAHQHPPFAGMSPSERARTVMHPDYRNGTVGRRTIRTTFICFFFFSGAHKLLFYSLSVCQSVLQQLLPIVRLARTSERIRTNDLRKVIVALLFNQGRSAISCLIRFDAQHVLVSHKESWRSSCCPFGSLHAQEGDKCWEADLLNVPLPLSLGRLQSHSVSYLLPEEFFLSTGGRMRICAANPNILLLLLN
jgi:hypothetical protein